MLKFEKFEDYAEVTLTCGKKTKVDLDDLDYVINKGWQMSNGYAISTTKHIKAMHRLIFGVIPEGMILDHKNRDRLDNRKSNLRICTYSQNAQNKKVIGDTKGVTFRDNKWNTSILVDGKFTYLGCFEDKETALRAYDSAAAFHFGEFACTNFKDVIPKHYLDIRKENCSRDSNKSSKYTGVCWKFEKWQAYVFYQGKVKHLGYYIDEEEAAKVRDAAILFLKLKTPKGLNFPDSTPRSLEEIKNSPLRSR